MRLASFRSLALIALTLPAVSCVGVNSTTQDQFTAWTAVTGQVLSSSSSDLPLFGVAVGVHLPANRTPSSYYAPARQTDDNGNFEVDVFRIADVTPTPEDTMTVWVLALAQKPGGVNIIDSTRATLVFAAPNARPASVPSVTIRLPISQ